MHPRPTSLDARATGAAEPLSAASAFAALDERVQRAGEHGTIDVALKSQAFASLARHLARRAQQRGRAALLAGLYPGADAWRDVARQLGLAADEPTALAARIAVSARGAVLIVVGARATNWGRAVATELSRLADDPDQQLLLVTLQEAILDKSLSGEPHRAESAPLFVHVDRLDAEDTRRWWETAVAQDAVLSDPSFAQLDLLDAWWEAARRRPLSSIDGGVGDLAEPARRLLACAVRAAEPLTVAQLLELAGDDGAQSVAELERTGAVERDRRGRVRARCAIALEADAERDRRIAIVLERDPEPDAWIAMRAAELYAAAGATADAERLAFDALGRSSDARARDDLWRRWETLLDVRRRDDIAAILRTAERALELGDSDRAEAMGRDALRLVGERFDVLLLCGRASAARGDLTGASLALMRALPLAHGDAERAAACAVMAEVRFLAGNLEDAQRHADRAIELAGERTATVRLSARNVLGKLLLARQAWHEAEQHFAEDMLEAARNRLTEAELRAQLNRGIAVQSSGRRDEARSMYDEIRRVGSACGNRRAVAYAASNLAVLAILDHDYVRALELSDEAIQVRRAIGDRLGLVMPITNLAELRLRVGLDAEAEQLLRFGLQACGTMPLSLHALFARVTAAIHLERGDTVTASREIHVALSGATGAGDWALAARCERLAARIALEDGDIERARAALSATSSEPTATGRAEHALLDAMLQRAAGENFLDAARHALTLGERADACEQLREIYVLLFHAHRLAGNEAAARAALGNALLQRDRIALALPETLRQRFLSRRGLRELALLCSSAWGPGAPRGAGSDGGDDAELVQQPRSNRAVALEPRRSAPAVERPMVGDAPSMRALRSTIRRVAATEATVLVHGPTGTGKELVAEAIHRHSRRSAGPLVKVNCAALVETLLLSELFGHEKGAFTGAAARRRGRFEVADGGTLFLDEIGDISARTQVALLRVLQDGTFERVGGCTPMHANVRVVCATHRDLRAMVERGEFREDLYYRLCGMVIEVAALKDRVADLPVLADALLQQAASQSGIELRPIAQSAIRTLSRHGWPGNVRELENAVRVAALFAKGEQIELADFTENVESLRYLGTSPAALSLAGGSVAGASRPSTPPPSSDDVAPSTVRSTEVVYAEVRGGTKLADMKRHLERECIARALLESAGNITKAAALLGMKRPRLSQLVKQYKLGSVVEACSMEDGAVSMEGGSFDGGEDDES